MYPRNKQAGAVDSNHGTDRSGLLVNQPPGNAGLFFN